MDVFSDTVYIGVRLTQIRYIIADDDGSQPLQLGDHPLFTQMDVLIHFDDNTVGWKEISRFAQHSTLFVTGPNLERGHGAQSPRPPTKRGPPTKPFNFYFALTVG